MGTAGGTSITITGSNFGPTSSSGIAATYGGSSGTDYSATSCSVSTAHTTITCTSSVGVGADHKWIVTVGGQTSALSSATLSYTAPAITDVSFASVSTLATAGGESMVLEGTNFGPTTGDTVAVSYGGTGGDLFTATSCSVSVANTRITCTSVTGYGSSLTFKVSVGSQTSSAYVTSLRYTSPSISGLAVSTTTMDTAGGQSIVVSGSNLGPQVGSNAVTATFGESGTGYTATSCSVTSANSEITCTVLFYVYRIPICYILNRSISIYISEW